MYHQQTSSLRSAVILPVLLGGIYTWSLRIVLLELDTTKEDGWIYGTVFFLKINQKWFELNRGIKTDQQVIGMNIILIIKK